MHPLVYLPLPPTTHRRIHTPALLPAKLSHIDMAGMKVHQWKENLDKLQFVADTQPSLPACLASFSGQLRTETVLCVREILHWIKCVTQGSHDCTLEMELRCEIVCWVERHPASPWFIFLFILIFCSMSVLIWHAFLLISASFGS